MKSVDLYVIFEFVVEPGSKGASPHIHKQLTEMFCAVEGEVELSLDECKVSATSDSFVFVLENTPHGFSNPG